MEENKTQEEKIIEEVKKSYEEQISSLKKAHEEEIKKIKEEMEEKELKHIRALMSGREEEKDDITKKENKNVIETEEDYFNSELENAKKLIEN